MRAVALLVVVTALAGCEYIITGPVLGYETDDESCVDTLDNDGDGAADCEDPDCWVFSNRCGEFPTDVVTFDIEDTLEECSDFIDNDGNEFFDCEEFACQDILELCCVLEFDDVHCSDGIDNDRDGDLDCQDRSCFSGLFVTVCDERTDATCDDGKDNDADGTADCDDSDCEGTAPCAPDVDGGEKRRVGA